MSTDQTWGAPAPEKATWSTRKTLAAVGIAAVLAAGGGLVIYAATSGQSHDAGPGGWGGPGGGGPMGGPGRQGPMGGPGDLPPALHGEYVVPNNNGGFRTEFTQTGTVTDMSGTSITLKSADGYTRTYAITTTTRQPREALQSGQQAAIQASAASDGPVTATAILPAR